MEKKKTCLGVLAIVISFMIAGCDMFGGDEPYAPPPPTQVRAMMNQDGSVTITWHESPGAVRYEIAFRTEFESETTRRMVAPAFITSFTHRPIGLGGGNPVLIYHVRAANRTSPSDSEFRQSVWSSPGVEVASVPWTTGNTPLQNLRAERDGHQIRITWDRLPAAIWYQIQISADSGVTWDSVFADRPAVGGGGNALSAPPISFPLLPEDAVYHVRGRASNMTEDPFMVGQGTRLFTGWATVTVR